MCGITGSLVISKVCGKGGKRTASSSCFYPFQQTVISTANGFRRFWLVVRSINTSRVFLVARLLAVRHDLRSLLEVLMRLDDRKRMAEALVLDNRGMADSLVLTKGAVGKNDIFPTHLERPVCIVVKLNILASKVF